MAADQASTTTAMTLRRHLIHRLGLAAFDVVLVAVAMMDLHLGIGVMIGLGLRAIISAVRDHRREQKRSAEAAELAELDRRLALVLASVREVVDQEQGSWS